MAWTGSAGGEKVLGHFTVPRNRFSIQLCPFVPKEEAW